MSRTDRERFDRWAPSYDQCFVARFFFRPLHRRLARLAAVRPGQRVLDVGAGTGSLAAAIADAGNHADALGRTDCAGPAGAARGGESRVVGIDPSFEMVRAANAKMSGSFAVAAAEALPFAGATFDLVLTSVSMHHWDDAGRGIAEMSRVLRPDGRALICDLELGGPLTLLSHFGHSHSSHHARLLRANDLARILEPSGMRVVSQRRVWGILLVTFARRRVT